MTTPTLKIVASYVLENRFKAHVRPYRVGGPCTNEVGLWLKSEQLPEADHWRVVMEAQIMGKNAEKGVCFEAFAEIEAIVLNTPVEGETVAEREEAVRYSAGAYLMAMVRQQLTQASLHTGYGPLVLPPIDSNTVAKLPAKEPAPAQLEGVTQ
ncbi:hypothetical protein LC612_30155 [Nostoc sp. CHAB 5834]|nr:hypothetical protein [Nostoc sp. CHAB 5834]